MLISFFDLLYVYIHCVVCVIFVIFQIFEAQGINKQTITLLGGWDGR